MGTSSPGYHLSLSEAIMLGVSTLTHEWKHGRSLFSGARCKHARKYIIIKWEMLTLPEIEQGIPRGRGLEGPL